MRHKKRDNVLYNATNADDLADKPQTMNGKQFTDFDVYDTSLSEHRMDGRGYSDDSGNLSEVVDTQSRTASYDNHRVNLGRAYSKKR